MSPHDIAMHRIESELKWIPSSLIPTEVASRACMAAYLACELSAITAADRDAIVQRIRAAEMIRFLELLKVAA